MHNSVGKTVHKKLSPAQGAPHSSPHNSELFEAEKYLIAEVQ